MNTEEYEQYQMQSDLNRQQAEAQNVPYAPQVYEAMQQQQAVLVEQTDPKRIVEKIVLNLQGKSMEEDGTIKTIGVPLLNNKGVNELRFLLNSYINDNSRFSHLKGDNIKKIMTQLSDDLVGKLRLNYYKWEIKNKTVLDDINNSILINVFNILKRAEDQNEKNWLGKISVETISGSSGIQKPKGGMLSKFKL